jgi:hypothetical protein
MSVRRRLKRLEAKFARLKQLKAKRTAANEILWQTKAYESFPSSVKNSIEAAFERLAESGGPDPNDVEVDALDLPEDLKQQIIDAFAVGYWRGPPDPPYTGPLPELHPPAAEPPAPEPSQTDPEALERAASESTARLKAWLGPPMRNRDVYGVPERYWRKIRL